MLKIHLLKAGEEEIERSGQKGNNRSLSIHVKNTTGYRPSILIKPPKG